MHCVSITTSVKPPEAMVWAFSVIRQMWPDACGCHDDDDLWSGLQRAYGTESYRVYENRQAASACTPVSVSWNDRLVVCGAPEIVAKLSNLPQWKHALSPIYPPGLNTAVDMSAY